MTIFEQHQQEKHEKFQQGMHEGMHEGIQQGANEKAEFSAVNMLKRGLSVEMIAECIGMRESAVRALAKKSFH